MTPAPTLLLFDIDGTLLRCGGAGMRAMRTAAQRLFGDRFRWDGVTPGGNLDPLIFATAARASGLDDHDHHHRRFHDAYIAHLPRELAADPAQVRIMPGVLDLLALLRRRRDERRDVTLGLLTGNYTAAVPHKLRAVQIDPGWFTLTVFGDEAPTRPDMVRLALERHTAASGGVADPRRVIVIGDTVRDIDCARAHGCVAVAVATGPVSYEELAAAGPDVLLRDLSDAGPVLSLLDRD